MNKFFDVGFHHGGGLRWFRDHYAMDDRWMIFCFEPNPANHSSFEHGAGVVNLPIAAWTFDGTISFRPHETGNGRGDGDGSSVMPDWQLPGMQDPIEVPCIDFARFLNYNTSASDRVVVKLDIEGAEYPVCRHLIHTLAIRCVDQLHVEFHDRLLPDETEESTEALVDQLRRHTTFHHHY